MLLGLLVGLRHAFEPDHMTALSTLVHEARGAKHGMWLGILWGIGHTVSLLCVGVLLVLLGASLPPRLGIAFELAVAVMLLVLGARTLFVSSNLRDHPHPQPARRGWRPLAIGLVHGLAGSGALTALVFAQLPDSHTRLIYIVVFGIGSIVGMGVASGVAGATLRHVHSAGVRRGIGIATGLVSIGVGLWWGIPLLAA
jgi:high-affinity nickel-transport protein